MERAPLLRQAPGMPWPRVALFCGLLAVHVALLLLPRQVLHRVRPAPLALIYLPEPKASTPDPTGAAHPSKKRAPSARAAPAIALTPATPGSAPAERPRVDWSTEAAITAEHLTQLANAPPPRSLDDHHGHRHQEGVGLNSHEASEFGWNQTAIHRFDTRGEIPIIRLSDRCVLPLGPFIPLPACGFGKKIEPRGDLFEHMHDSAAAPSP